MGFRKYHQNQNCRLPPHVELEVTSWMKLSVGAVQVDLGNWRVVGVER